jgi:hypothetical protein
MFEVGKKYKLKNHLYQCLFVGSQMSVLRNECNYFESAVPNSYHLNYVEYVEPRKEFFNAYKNASGTYYDGPYTSREAAHGFVDDAVLYKFYGTLIVTHHSDGKVETEFHIKRK